VSRELERAQRTLDGVKQVNDSQSHLAGDKPLQLVGETLRANVRPTT
jgi:GGDEF domain-containing protein